jgi:hypothetical protein
MFAVAAPTEIGSLVSSRRPGHVGSVDSQLTSQQVEPHAEITCQGVEGMLESCWLILLENEVSQPSESVAVEKKTKD